MPISHLSYKITEVGPRDGLQNEKNILSVEQRFEFIKLLILAGLKNIEVGSFVREDKIPQLHNSGLVFEKIMNDSSLHLSKDHHFSFLVPNLKGLNEALKYGVREISFFTSISESFTQRNIHSTISESLERFKLIKKNASDMKIRAYISSVFHCPYEGKVSKEELFKQVDFFLQQGCEEVSLGDTTGMATSIQVEEIGQEIKKRFGTKQIAWHFHDTQGLALCHILMCLQQGFHSFDSSLGGLGGCPYAKGASGNVATEEVLWLLHQAGFDRGCSREEIFHLTHLAIKMRSLLGRTQLSTFQQFVLAQDNESQ